MSERRSSSRRSENQQRRSSSAKEKVLERLKNYRKTGEKVDYAGGDDDDVYDYVEEDEYAQIVQERQQDDFIVDDDGTGYQDDGREIFDDDLTAEKPAEKGKGKTKGKKEDGKPGGTSAKQKAKITSMFAAATSMKKKSEKPKDVTLKDDEFLDDLLNSMLPGDSSSSTKPISSSSVGASVKPLKSSKKHAAPRKVSIDKKAIKRKPLTSLSQRNSTSSKEFPVHVKEEIR